MESQQNSYRHSKKFYSLLKLFKKEKEGKEKTQKQSRSIPQTLSVKPFKKEREETETLRVAPVVSPKETWTWVTG